jgi:hypothetical protein
MITVHIPNTTDTARTRYLSFAIGQTVYNKSDLDQIPMIIRAVIVYNEHIEYVCREGETLITCFESELSDTQNKELMEQANGD